MSPTLFIIIVPSIVYRHAWIQMSGPYCPGRMCLAVFHPIHYYYLPHCVWICIDTHILHILLYSLYGTLLLSSMYLPIHLSLCVTCLSVLLLCFLRASLGIPLSRAYALYPLEYAFRGPFLRSMPLPMSLTPWNTVSPKLLHSYPCHCLVCIFSYISYYMIHAPIVIGWN